MAAIYDFNFLICSKFILLTFIFVQLSLEETLSCGATSFQVTFEPSRPIFSGSFVTGVAAAAQSTSGAMSGSGDLPMNNNAMLGGAFPTAKYVYRPLSQLLPPNVALCNFSNGMDAFSAAMRGAATAMPPPTLLFSFPPIRDALDTKMIITKCDKCARCAHELPAVHRLLTRTAVDASLQSLLIIVHNVPSNNNIDSTFDIDESSRHILKDVERMKLIENSIAKFVFMNEDPGQLSICELMTDNVENDALKNFSKTSVLFVSISFIILMVISLAWLVFYYVQRFRYAHAKDRLQRRLFNAAKKALARIPTRPVKAGDKDLDMDCPVCIDPYKTGDIVRMLPCRHTFHKGCVDPWLLEHRTCPMCKSDILKAFGYQITVHTSGSSSSGSSALGGGGGGGGRRRAQFSNMTDASVSTSAGDFHYYHGHHNHQHTHQNHCGSLSAHASGGSQHSSRRSHTHRATLTNDSANFEEGLNHLDGIENDDHINIYDDHSTLSDSNVFPFAMISEIHDPFGLTPTTSPQFVQVIHTPNSRGFSIIPLSVNDKEKPLSAQSATIEEKAKSSEIVKYGRYFVDGVTKRENGINGVVNTMQVQQVQRKIYSADGNRRDSKRLFRTSTSGGGRQAARAGGGRRHLINLIHVRSLSFTNGQFPTSSSPSATGCEKNFESASVDIASENIVVADDETRQITRTITPIENTNSSARGANCQSSWDVTQYSAQQERRYSTSSVSTTPHEFTESPKAQQPFEPCQMPKHLETNLFH